jgi:uncharacterized protein (DUF305 family)
MDGDISERRASPVALAFVAAAVIAALVVAAFVWARLSRPADNSAEAGFARDMATHHDQAVEMAFILRETTTDARLRALTYDIIVTQSAQRGMFMAWLEQWGLPQASNGPRMAWMSSHAHMQGMSDDAAAMAGMATADDMKALRGATGAAAEVRFLQLMIRHHEGGVQMARALLAQSSRDEVVAIARNIDATQAAEIAMMKELLAERGATPLPSILK